MTFPLPDGEPAASPVFGICQQAGSIGYMVETRVKRHQY
jgi:hypothetical protein